MFRTLNETIKVTSSFFRNQVVPEIFEWQGKRHNIQKVKLIHVARKGENKMYFFDVHDESNLFKLSFDTKSLEWELNQIFVG